MPHGTYSGMPKLIVLLIAAAGFSFGSLIAGAGYLDLSLPGGLPLGNALTAVGFLAMAFAALLLSRPHSACRRAAQLALLASVVWLPASISLAGNLTLNFSGARGTIWLAISLLTAFLALGSLAWAAVRSLLGLARLRHSKSSESMPHRDSSPAGAAVSDDAANAVRRRP